MNIHEDIQTLAAALTEVAQAITLHANMMAAVAKGTQAETPTPAPKSTKPAKTKAEAQPELPLETEGEEGEPAKPAKTRTKPKTKPAPEPDPIDGDVDEDEQGEAPLTLAEVKTELRKLASRETIIKLLQKYGASTADGLDEEHYDAIVRDAQKIVKAA